MIVSSLGLVMATIACSQVLQVFATPTKEPKQFKGKALAELLNKDITAKPPRSPAASSETLSKQAKGLSWSDRLIFDESGKTVPKDLHTAMSTMSLEPNSRPTKNGVLDSTSEEVRRIQTGKRVDMNGASLNSNSKGPAKWDLAMTPRERHRLTRFGHGIRAESESSKSLSVKRFWDKAPRQEEFRRRKRMHYEMSKGDSSISPKRLFENEMQKSRSMGPDAHKIDRQRIDVAMASLAQSKHRLLRAKRINDAEIARLEKEPKIRRQDSKEANEHAAKGRLAGKRDRAAMEQKDDAQEELDDSKRPFGGFNRGFLDQAYSKPSPDEQVPKRARLALFQMGPPVP